MAQLPQLTDSTLSHNARVAELCFNRDDLRNALTGTALVEDLLATLEWCNTSPEVSVLIITGAGKAFSRPTALAVNLAQELNITLACLDKDLGLILLCGRERLVVNP